ncbi:apolipoprotein N-acyltransferase [Salinisphaera sp. Q1T1-3]|uniref:apolipoprotein N-acyltransferase n=1 Tax=Salinisphaera sp. Q1T1-3 TaxID=2321229 RepID=UPI000E751C3D|nr:apolipoprotein N-acyltransferase [Salinisphaera sp. Q1T1-3]RJS92177.1 apolipoprotein N-acyltransferase [Salinisphaera sp. Q1T1-3]
MTRLKKLLADGLLPALFGVLATLGFAPFAAWPATLAAVLGLVALWRGVGARRAAWRGFVFGVAQFATGIHWVYVAMHANAGMPAVLAGLATAGLALYLALYPALAGALVGAMRRLPLTPWALCVVPATWTLAEWLRSWLFSGFDWLAIGYAATDIPVNGIAPVVGVHGWSFLLVSAAGGIYMLYVGGLVARLIACGLALALPLLLWCLPPAVHWTQRASAPLSVAVMQGNVAQHDKWRPDNLAPTIDRYAAMTRRTDADLVVWPEVAVPAPMALVMPALDAVGKTARAEGKTVLAGVLRGGREPGSYYNALVALGAGQGEYHKRHLVPFGEYVPGPAWLDALLDGLGAPIGRLATGAADQRLLHAGSVRLGATICFEDVFGRNVIRDLPAAGVLVNVTNDGWFAGTIGPAQHLQIARMRAAEAGRPMVRAANTGISAIIDFTGRVYDRTAEDTTARLVGHVIPRTGATPYARHGETPVASASAAIVLLGGLAAGLLGWRRRRRDGIAERRRELARRV